jgi:hypothetical protein
VCVSVSGIDVREQEEDSPVQGLRDRSGHRPQVLGFRRGAQRGEASHCTCRGCGPSWHSWLAHSAPYRWPSASLTRSLAGVTPGQSPRSIRCQANVVLQTLRPWHLKQHPRCREGAVRWRCCSPLLEWQNAQSGEGPPCAAVYRKLPVQRYNALPFMSSGELRPLTLLFVIANLTQRVPSSACHG